MLNILVVEDNEDERSLLKIVLENEGYKVEEAENGKIALEKFVEQPPDLIVTDIVMPEREGLETIMELRRTDQKVKIIAMSGCGNDVGPNNFLKMAKHLGANFTIQKPIDIKEFVDLVNNVLLEK
jgi:CheY-like chemotaxis protein